MNQIIANRLGDFAVAPLARVPNALSIEGLIFGEILNGNVSN